MHKILVIAPHCDDEVLGCGGVIANHVAQGAEVFVAIMTNGHLGAPELFSAEGTQKVRSEALKAHQVLGVSDTYFLDFPAPRLDSVPGYQLSLRLHQLILDLQVDTIYIPHRGDIHKDHYHTFEAALVAARPINNNLVRRIYAYETLSETEWAAPYANDAFIPTRFVDITHTLEKKIEAFQCFTTQIKLPPHPRSIENIRNLARYRGATVGLQAAEAFMVIREIEKA